jgi:predicted transglutaminase-like cysteine proteinase
LSRAGFCVAFLAWALGSLGVNAQSILPVATQSVVAGPLTTRPVGHATFCKANPGECHPNDVVIDNVVLTDALYAQLIAVNHEINDAILAVTDLELYQVSELWAYPDAAGDCEDIVLAKRRALMDAGWPVSTLLITVVRQPSRAGHAVLMVRTDRGDLILDNLDPDVHPWSATPYTYIKRQAQEDSGLWVSITDDRTIVAVAAHD